MADCGGKSLHVVNAIVRSELHLMKMLRELLGEERKSLDNLRVERYNALEVLDAAKANSMELDCKPEEYKSVQEKENLTALLEKTIVRKQQYAAIISDIMDDRQRNMDQLSKESCVLISEEMAELDVS